MKKSTNKETFFEPKDGSEGKGEEINRYGISHTSFGSAPTAVLIASGDASRPNTTFARTQY